MDVTDSRDTRDDIFRLVGQRAFMDAGEVGEVSGESQRWDAAQHLHGACE